MAFDGPAALPGAGLAGSAAPGSTFRSAEELLAYSAKAGNRLVTRAAVMGGGKVTAMQQSAAAALAPTPPVPGERPKPSKANKTGDFVRQDATSIALQSAAQLQSPRRR